MHMPDMDGLMLAKEIRKLPTGVSLPLVMLTPVGVRTDCHELAGGIISGCLTKPIKPAQLHEALTRAVSTAKAQPKPAPAPISTKADAGLAARVPLRVMICDDNALNQKVAHRLVMQMGYKSDIAANGRLALDAIDRQIYDLIFMDVQMPEMDGLEATRHIRERQKDRAKHPNYKSPIIIIAMTANAMQGDREKCLAAGMDDYLSKPVRPEDVRKIVERWGAVIHSTSEVAPALPQVPTANSDVSMEAIVDIPRLMDLTDGTTESLRELVNLYLTQTSGQMEQLATAAAANDAKEIRRVAHSCAGASATCGILRIVPILRELERQGDEGKLTNAVELCRQCAEEFARVKTVLETHLANHQATTPA
jgi:CheY-like chemotaxis protein